MEKGRITHTDVQNVMKKSKTNFFYSSLFLSKPKREGLRAVYAYCRLTDDIVDDESLTPVEKSEKLRIWKERLIKSLNGVTGDDFFDLLKEQVDIFRIPQIPFFDLIDGMEMDIVKSRYGTIEELYKYCYCAASSVGLMSVEIFGYKNPETRKYAEYLGVALQLTNILRDVKKDAANNRIYLPLEDLKRFNYTEEELISSVYNENFKRLMEFEYARAEDYYNKAGEHLAKEDRKNMVAAIIMGKIYHELLLRIKYAGFDVFRNDVRVPKLRKLLIAYGTFLKFKF